MRICLLTRALPVHNKGGLEYHSYDLGCGIAARSHEVTVLTSAHPKGEPRECNGNLTIHYLPGTTPGKYSLTFFRQLNKHLQELHTEKPFDIVHAQGLAGMLLSRHLMRTIKERYVVTIHGTLFSETPLYRKHFQRYTLPQKVEKIWQYKHRIAVYPFYKRLLNDAVRIIVDSHFTADELKLFRQPIASRARIVPLGVPEARYPCLSKSDARRKLNLNGTILFTLGRIEEMKGVKVALEAMRLIERRDFQYLIGGTGKQASELRAFCTRHNLSNVRFLGELASEDVPLYLAAADLFLYPELAQPAFGLVAIEAMLQGTPVLASRAGAIPEVVTPHVGFLFERGNASSLATELTRLLAAPQLLQAASAACRQYVLQNFSYDTMIDRTMEVYREIQGR